VSGRRNDPLRFPFPEAVQRVLGPMELNLSPSRVIPLLALLAFGLLAGLVFNTGVGHPHDKIIHVIFFALLTLTIHGLLSCRLRLSAIAAFTLGLGGEAVQGLLPHHETSLQDAFANAVGIALVVVAIALKRSEVKQALKDQTITSDLDKMGLEPLEPVHSDPSSGRSDFGSDR